MLKCGASDVNITPELGVHMPGGWTNRPAQYVYDELYTHAIVFEDDNMTIAFASVDTLYVSFAMVKAIREMVNEQTGIPKENILVAATHTHFSFEIDLATYKPEEEKFTAPQTVTCAKKIASAIVLAYKRRRDAVIGFGSCEEHDISFIRRFFMKTGGVRMNPPMMSPDLIKPEGVIDPEVGIIRVDTPEGEPIAVMSNFACHLCVASKDGYSADFGGEISNEIKRALGDNVVSVFFAGCCGNINHIDFTGGHPYGKDHHIKMGRILGYKILFQREKIKCTAEAALGVSSEDITVDRRQPTAENIAYMNEVFAKAEPTPKELSYANSYKYLSENPKMQETFEVQTFKIGDIGFTGLPGEIFVECGFAVKEGSPFKNNFVIELANGCLGYVSTPEAQKNGGYETELSRYTFTPPETIGLMSDSAVKQLKQLAL